MYFLSVTVRHPTNNPEQNSIAYKKNILAMTDYFELPPTKAKYEEGELLDQSLVE